MLPYTSLNNHRIRNISNESLKRGEIYAAHYNSLHDISYLRNSMNIKFDLSFF
jgi:hypothetical protein